MNYKTGSVNENPGLPGFEYGDHPMKCLGIVCSSKKMGNSELAVKRILTYCRENGAEVKLVRISDWKFTACKGCFNCLFKKSDCPIEDDLEEFAGLIFGYDKLVIGSPTYLLYPPGIVKMIIDRVGIFAKKAEVAASKATYPVAAVLVGISGVKKWDAFTIPMLSLFAKVITGYQARIVDKVLLYHPGPGELLLDESSLRRLDEMGSTLLSDKERVAIPLELDATIEGAFVCPVCGSNSFMISNINNSLRTECPLCGVEGELVDGKKIFIDPVSLENHRLTENGAKEFVNNWILRTRDGYMERFKKIALLKGVYKDSSINMEWELP